MARHCDGKAVRPISTADRVNDRSVSRLRVPVGSIEIEAAAAAVGAIAAL